MRFKRDQHIIPKGLRITSPINSPAARDILHTASQRLITGQICRHRKINAISLKDISDHINQLNTTLQPDTFSSLRTAQTQEHKHHRKTVVNLSKKDLTTEQTNILSKGLKCIPTRPQRNHDDFISTIEKGFSNSHQGVKSTICVTRSVTFLQKPHRKLLSSPELRQKPIRIAPVDKGKATVIMDTFHFHELVNILQEPTTYSKITKDQTAELLRQHKTLLRHLKDIFEISKVLHHQLSVNHPRPPYARTSIKIHKNPPIVRLLVCSRDNVKTAQHPSVA
ncbi:uncharacterized protein [Haliotis cracherodii]|uniref:uncharacterized protein n=1 Tax=Haliotis cracherodii TaxID=6455 RepID=UPI0039E9284E